MCIYVMCRMYRVFLNVVSCILCPVLFTCVSCISYMSCTPSVMVITCVSCEFCLCVASVCVRACVRSYLRVSLLCFSFLCSFCNVDDSTSHKTDRNGDSG